MIKIIEIFNIKLLNSSGAENTRIPMPEECSEMGTRYTQYMSLVSFVQRTTDDVAPLVAIF